MKNKSYIYWVVFVLLFWPTDLTMLSFHDEVSFFITIQIGSPYLVHSLIMEGTKRTLSSHGNVRWNLSKPNPFRTINFVWNRQVFGLDRLNSLKFTILGLNLMFSLYRISVYSGFGLGRFHCFLFLPWYSYKTTTIAHSPK